MLSDLIKIADSKIEEFNFLYASCESNLQKAEKVKTECEQKSQLIKEAILLCQACLEDQTELKDEFERMISEGYSRVFPEYDMSFLFEPVYKSDNVTLSGLKPVVDEHGTTQDLRKAHGFGVVDVTCALLNLIFLKMHEDKTQLIVWDESLAFTNYLRLPMFLDFLQELAEIDNFKCIFITNNKLDEKYITHRFIKEGQVSSVENL